MYWGAVYLNDLGFADDFFLIANSPEELHAAINEVGPKMNRAKTKIILSIFRKIN